MSSTNSQLNRRFCVAPMLDCTDKHDRYLLRLISNHSVLYTEMVTTGAILFGDKERFLSFNQQEHPVALQLGGSEVPAMVQSAEIAQEYGYDEVNINVGCPSDRVQSGQFGACLMLTPTLVAENVKAMTQAVDIPITIKTRIGVDEQVPQKALWEITELCAEAGCKTFIVHARKAWLKGLSPKQNRDVPPLDYELVYKLKESFPELEIIINGGISTIEQSQQHLTQVDGVMIGREAYSNPFMLSAVDQEIYGVDAPRVTREQVLEEYIAYAKHQIEQGCRVNHLARHAVGLFHGQANSRLWRRHISENAHLPTADWTMFDKAYSKMMEENVI